MATVAYGEPRSTLDIDVVVRLELDQIEKLRALFPRDFYFDTDSARTAVGCAGQFNVIDPSSGLKIDFFVEGDHIERRQIDEARRLPAGADLTARFSPPEELILKKLEYYRAGGSDKHLRDVTGILRVSAEAVDRSKVEREAERLGLAELWSEVSRR
jgi:hypothetical protein